MRTAPGPRVLLRLAAALVAWLLPVAVAAPTGPAPGRALAAELTPAGHEAVEALPAILAPTRRDRQAAAPRLRDAPGELLPPPRAGTSPPPPGSPRAACLAAARRAEGVHGLPEGLMVAIALSESGLHAHALSIRGQAHYPVELATARQMLLGAAGRGAVMAGCVQVNAGVHARGADWPLDAERAADWAGGMLRRWYVETGSWTEALRRWHGGSAGSAHRVVCRVRAKLEAVAPGSGLLDGQGCSTAEAARLRRSGEALLEVAEAPGS